jgi:hypothetical protein
LSNEEKTNDYENFEKGMIYMKILKKRGVVEKRGEEETKSMPHAPVLNTWLAQPLGTNTKALTTGLLESSGNNTKVVITGLVNKTGTNTEYLTSELVKTRGLTPRN